MVVFLFLLMLVPSAYAQDPNEALNQVMNLTPQGIINKPNVNLTSGTSDFCGEDRFHKQTLEDIKEALQRKNLPELTIKKVRKIYRSLYDFNEPLDENGNTFLILLSAYHGDYNVDDIAALAIKKGADPELANLHGAAPINIDPDLFERINSN